MTVTDERRRAWVDALIDTYNAEVRFVLSKGTIGHGTEILDYLGPYLEDPVLVTTTIDILFMMVAALAEQVGTDALDRMDEIIRSAALDAPLDEIERAVNHALNPNRKDQPK